MTRTYSGPIAVGGLRGHRGRLSAALPPSPPRRRGDGGVCARGAMILAGAGLTAGRRATTHHVALDDLEATG
ncbi:MAG: hypothetical protein LC792_14035, partial [Actinobacteria bacterium]|nr:hypothetical protein [Actinomycetota bacterium]